MTDAYQRQINYLRVSVTDQCNLSCCYCAPFRPGHGGTPLPPKDRLMSFDEMLRLVKIGVDLGISKVRLTGGEPLCRRGVTRFIEKLSRIPGIKDIGLTTNGILLESMARELRDAGLNRINVSLDTLGTARFKQITGKDAWHRVWDGIMAALALGFSPVKINTVVMKGVNDDEVVDMARLSLLYPLHVRFIEYMPIGPDPRTIRGYFISGTELKNRVGQLGKLIPMVRAPFDGPARRFKIQGAPGEVGFISSMSDHFCSRCNRMRLTATGALRPCLLADDEVELVRRLREGCSDSRLRELFFKALSMKQGAHGLDFEGHGLKTKMVQIGG
ncbi:MAG: GTP 3',8-cyclase MoaA [Desulfobacter sp.]|nr:MAG: GTP 3',8-cyclase MoaA [Desulfobacter sp.]